MRGATEKKKRKIAFKSLVHCSVVRRCWVELVNVHTKEGSHDHLIAGSRGCLALHQPLLHFTWESRGPFSALYTIARTLPLPEVPGCLKPSQLAALAPLAAPISCLLQGRRCAHNTCVTAKMAPAFVGHCGRVKIVLFSETENVKSFLCCY